MKKLRVISLVHHFYIGGDASRLLAYSRALDKNVIDHSMLLIIHPDADINVAHGSAIEHFRHYDIKADHLGEWPRKQRSRLGWASSAWQNGTEIIANGIYSPHSDKTRAQMRRLFNIPQDALVFGKISRLLAYKGLHILSAAQMRFQQYFLAARMAENLNRLFLTQVNLSKRRVSGDDNASV